MNKLNSSISKPVCLLALITLMSLSAMSLSGLAQDEAKETPADADAAAPDEAAVPAEAAAPTEAAPQTEDVPDLTDENTEVIGATLNHAVDNDGTRTIVIKSGDPVPKPPVFYTSSGNAVVQIGTESIEQVIDFAIKVVQGDAKTVSLGINGEDQITEILGEGLKSWSVRQEGAARFLDLHVNEQVKELKVQIKTRSRRFDLKTPVSIVLTHLSPADSV